MTTQTKPADLRRKRRQHYDWRPYYAEHMCVCLHFDTAHSKKGTGPCEGVQEDGPCPCQAWTQKEAANG